jgi:diguanylate cyclase (GGDEF)-like protein
MVIGVLEAGETSADEDSERVLEALLSTAAAAMESARLHSSARELAEIDALTQLPNRRRMEGDLEIEWERCRRYSRPLSFLMLDLDHFKRLNDTYGHLVGDTVLNAAAIAISSSLRGTDTAYRYGGEEIAVLLRETELAEALIVAERIRDAVAEVVVEGTEATVTASLGAAQMLNSMLQQTELVSRADEALYEAKRKGRDQVVASSAHLQGV